MICEYETEWCRKHKHCCTCEHHKEVELKIEDVVMRDSSTNEYTVNGRNLSRGKVMDDRIYVKEDRLDIYYNSGELEDGTVFDKPYLMVARINRQDMTIENRFYGDEAVELYKKLTEYRR